MKVKVKRERHATIPTECPLCNGEVVLDTMKGAVDGEKIFLRCLAGCANTGFQIMHFTHALRIKGIGESVAAELAEAGITNPLELFDADRLATAFKSINKVGVGNRVLKEIERVRSGVELWRVLAGFSITRCGEGTAKSLVKNFNTLDAILNVTSDDLILAGDFGQDNARLLAQGITDKSDEIRKFVDATGIQIIEKEPTSQVPEGEQALKGLSFCVTGKVNYPGARNALHELIEVNGGEVHKSVRKDTSFLITNDPGDAKSIKKVSAAQKHGVDIINEKQFLEKVGL
jgi:DNA ligase (NAD+)